MLERVVHVDFKEIKTFKLYFGDSAQLRHTIRKDYGNIQKSPQTGF